MMDEQDFAVPHDKNANGEINSFVNVRHAIPLAERISQPSRKSLRAAYAGILQISHQPARQGSTFISLSLTLSDTLSNNFMPLHCWDLISL
jgi:hypothetical protein